MKDQTYTLSSYEPVYVLAPEIEIPAETIRAEMIDSLRRHHCKDGEEPRLTDAWIAAHTDDFQTVEQYEIVVKYNLYKEAQKYQRFQDEDIICAALAERLVEDVPQEVVDEAGYAAHMRFDQYLRENGLTKEEYCAQQDMTEEELDKQLVDQAVQSYREDAALEAYARHEGMTLDSDDIYAVIPGDSIEEKLETRRKIERNGGMAGLEDYALKVKAMRLIVENAMIKRKEYGEYVRLGAVSVDIEQAYRENPEAFLRF